MQIIYKDEYGVSLYWGASSHPANIGDTVIIEDEEYRVKSRIFSPVKDDVSPLKPPVTALVTTTVYVLPGTTKTAVVLA